MCSGYEACPHRWKVKTKLFAEWEDTVGGLISCPCPHRWLYPPPAVTFTSGTFYRCFLERSQKSHNCCLLWVHLTQCIYERFNFDKMLMMENWEQITWKKISTLRTLGEQRHGNAILEAWLCFLALCHTVWLWAYCRMQVTAPVTHSVKWENNVLLRRVEGEPVVHRCFQLSTSISFSV